MSALKKGQAPVGFGIQKQPEPASTPIPQSKVIPPPAPHPLSRTTIPPAQSSSQLTPKITVPPSITNIPKPTSSIGTLHPPVPEPVSPRPGGPAGSSPGSAASLTIPPPSKSMSSTALVLILAVVAVVGFSVWFFIFHQPSAPGLGVTPTQVASITPTATPLPPLESVFSKVGSVVAPLSDQFFKNLETNPSVQGLASGEIGLYKVGDPVSGKRYNFNRFSDGTLIKFPPELTSLLDDSNLYFSMMRKADGKISYAFIVKTNSSANATAALRKLEPALTNSLSRLFNFNPTKAAFAGFKENNVSYPNVGIRYRNFPDPSLTIDYTVILAPNGESYLVFANSRDQMFAIVERIETISSSGVPPSEVPGK